MPTRQLADDDSLRAFHHLAADVRSYREAIGAAKLGTGVTDDYVAASAVLEAYRPLCVRIRRVLTESDRASLVQTCRILTAVGSERIGGRVEELTARYRHVVEDLRSSTTLNHRPVPHTDVFEAWLNAAIFGAFDSNDVAYRSLFDECGKAVEGIAVRITEAFSQCVLDLDDVVAAVLASPTP